MHLAPCDLVLVEGYKHATIPKIEIQRSAVGHPCLFPDDPHIIAVVTDRSDAIPLPKPNLNAPQEVVAFILQHSDLSRVA